ncbi:MAG: TIGR02099 family protein [Burkholderiaceae bacterium]|nr:TIGR02099 family protein [Burkholderiaceae bacterium]
MTEPSPQPTRLLRAMAVLARWSLGVMLAAGLFLSATWGALHGWIVPRIGDYRLQLQEQAERALGVPVRLGAVSAVSNGLIPSVELREVVLLDAQGREALRLPRVVLALSARSLWRLGLEQLYIESPHLDIRRSADGRLSVAGLTLADNPSGDSPGADWLFAQPEVLVRGGTVRWTDEQRSAPALVLGQVDVLLRNRAWQHRLRIDATPPSEWGTRFSLMGAFRQPLLSTHSGRWQRWSGQLFADFAQLDLSRLRDYADVGIDLAQGQGALRAWLDVERGQWVGAVADIFLTDVHATTEAGLQPLGLAQLQGRLSGRRLNQGFEAATQGLQFVTDDGLRWPGGDMRLQYSNTPGRERGEFQADRLDLAALAQVAQRLPLGQTSHNALQRYAPRGLVESLRAQWQGPPTKAHHYQVQGRISGLALADTPAARAASSAETQMPLGLRGANIDVQATQDGGSATVALTDGALLLPGIFEDPVLALTRLNAQVRWKVDGENLSVQVNDAQFANADAQGQARAQWHTSDPARSGSKSRFPGVLELSGSLSRADGTRAYRYLPLVIPQQARHYVRDAVRTGRVPRVDFRVKGDLHDLPFQNSKQGEFRIAAQVKDATYAYVPPPLQAAGELPWPALAQLEGELIFERASMRVQGAHGILAGTRNTRLSRVEAHIPDLSNPVVTVNGEARGPLPEWLAFVRTSPLDAMIDHALARASGSGNADLRLRLQLPIHQLGKSQVQGSVMLAGNDVRITPDAPALSRARGTVQFSETGFALQGVQARALGGDVRLEGGLRALAATAPATESALQMRAQGTASAQGLQQASELGFLAPLTRHATGSAPYTLALTLRRGVPEVQVQTSLQGLALALPAPLGKSADSAMPLRIETRLTRESLVTTAPGAPPAPLHEQITIEGGRLGHVQYVRDIGSAPPQVLRGAIAVGLAAGESMPLPAHGVAANLQLGQVDVDAWEKLLSDGNTAAPAPATLDYLPSVLALRAQTVTAQGRSLHNVVAGGTHQGTVWRTTLDSTELSGHLEYRPAGSPDSPGGRLFARLSRLTVPQSEATQVETLLAGQPGQLPALDIEIDKLELRGRKLGRLEIEAVNRGGEGVQREWRLQKFNLTTPEAALTANGNWALANTPGPAAAGPQRRTALNFKLDIRDAGQLLGRFGMADVVRQGRGQLQGQVAWRGTPFSPDYPSMTGQMHLNIETGQFLQADPGLAKLLGVLSLQSLPRRLALDFRDVFSQGFAFDWVRGDVRIDHGIASSNNLQMKGVNAAVLMEGSADISRETQSLHVVVVPEINAMTASLVATAINPVVGLGSFLAQMFLRGPLSTATTQEFQIDGTWTDPHVVRLRGAARTGRNANAPEPASSAPPAEAPSTADIERPVAPASTADTPPPAPVGD